MLICSSIGHLWRYWWVDLLCLPYQKNVESFNDGNNVDFSQIDSMYTYNTRECGDDLTAVSYGRPHCREPTFWCLTMGALRRDPRRGGESINRSGSNSVPSDKGV